MRTALICFLAAILTAPSAAVYALDVETHVSQAEKSMKHSFLAELVADFEKSGQIGSGDKNTLTTATYSETGFVYLNYFAPLTNVTGNNGACGVQTNLALFPVNYCLLSGDRKYTMKFQLSQDSCTDGVVQYFTDINCIDFVGTSPLSGYGACSATGDNAELAPATMRTVTCTTANEANFDGTYVFREFFNGNCTGQPYYGIGYKTDLCQRFGTINIMLQCGAQGVPGLPEADAHFAADCSDDSVEAGLNTECAAMADIAADDDYEPPFVNPPPSVATTAFPTPASSETQLKAVYFCTGYNPTSAPVPAPTAFPTTAVAAAVKFGVTQLLVGIDIAAFYGNPLNPSTTIYTIAQSMTGITVDDITHFEAVSVIVVPTIESPLAFGKSVRSRQLTESGVQLRYTVSAPSSTYTADQLFAQLSDVVSSGAFTTALYNSAVFFGAMDLQSVSCNSVTTAEPADDDTDSGGSDSSDRLSDEAIIGIAVGAGVAAFLLGASLVYFVMRRPSTPMASQHGGSSA